MNVMTKEEPNKILTTTEKILQEFEDFIIESGLDQSQFGQFSINDGNLIGEMRRGRSVNSNTYDRIKGWMSQHKQSGAFCPPATYGALLDIPEAEKERRRAFP